MKNSEEEAATMAVQGEGEDHFRRLPIELLLVIFSKLPDFKFLCRCSLVSKRFASTILLISTVSISLPRPNYDSSKTYVDLLNLDLGGDNFRQKYFNYLRNPPQSTASASSSSSSSSVSVISKTADFLMKFNEIRSIHIEFSSDSCNCGRSWSLVKWKAKFGMKLGNLAFLLSMSHRKRTEEEDEEEEGPVITADELIYQTRLAADCVKDAYTWRFFMLLLINGLPMLERVTITDSNKRGKMCVRDEELVELRSLLKGTTIGLVGIPYRVQKAYVPLLHLPSSGYVMKGVTLVLFRMVEKVPQINEDEDDDDDISIGDFEEEEKVFGEAVTEILMKHKDKIETMF